MRPLLLFSALCMMSLLATPADACVCRWFGREKGAQTAIAAAAGSADVVVHGTIVEEIAVAPGSSAWSSFCPGVAFWRTLRVDRTIVGQFATATPEQPVLVKVMISRPLQPSSSSCGEMTSCDVRPAVGAEQIWGHRQTNVADAGSGASSPE